MNKQDKDEIKVSKLLEILWAEKLSLILYVFIITISFWLFFKTFNEKPKQFRSQIVIKSPPKSILLPYRSFVEVGDYHKYFKNSILSLDNFKSFIKQYDKKKFLNYYIENENLILTENFQNKFGEIDKNTFYYIYNLNEDGNRILYDYIKFVKDKSSKEFLNELKNIILINIAEYERNLVIADKINQENLISNDFNYDKFQLIIKSEDSFLIGSEVLTEKITHYKSLIIKLENNFLNYDYIYQEPISKEIFNFINIKFFVLYGFLFGIIISIIIIFIKRKII